MNYYELLEVSPNASEAVLKAAYKSLMQRYHPDRNPGDAEAAEHSILVAHAYEVLSDPGKRAAYDIEFKRQLADLGKVQSLMCFPPVLATGSDTEREQHWYIWLIFGLILLIIWFIWPSFENVQISDSGLKEIGSGLGSYQLQLQPSRNKGNAVDTTARTIPVYIEKLTINLANEQAEYGQMQLSDPQHVLTIQTLGVVVGAIDANEFISFLENNKEFITRELAEKLASARYEMLVKHNGDEYLERLILDSIGEITGTSKLGELSSTGMGSPDDYGAVDVLLPDSFTVR